MGEQVNQGGNVVAVGANGDYRAWYSGRGSGNGRTCVDGVVCREGINAVVTLAMVRRRIDYTGHLLTDEIVKVYAPEEGIKELDMLTELLGKTYPFRKGKTDVQKSCNGNHALADGAEKEAELGQNF